MRHLAIRFCAASMLATAMLSLQAGSAAACIRFDRAAEMALIERAIASSRTPNSKKQRLRELKDEIVAVQNRSATSAQDVGRNHTLTTEALALIGKKRVVLRVK